MTVREKQKVILVITEGITDFCIPEAFDEHFSTRQFNGVAANGDVTVSRIDATSLRWATRGDLAKALRKIIADDIAQRHLYAIRNIIGVAQLTDLDGAYIPDERVVNGEEFLYLNDRIITPGVDGIINRNRLKRRRIDALRNIQELHLTRAISVPYRLFYSSRNLEHAMHGEVDNLSVPQKRNLSLLFSEKAQSDPEWFKSLVTSDDVLHGQTDYAESWEWATKGLNSLARGSNIGLLPEQFGLSW